MRRAAAMCLLLGTVAACPPPASRDGGVAAVDRGGPSAPEAVTTDCVVTRIVDGDTIICAPNQRVRLIGMDTPEMRHVPFGRQARDTLAMLVPAGARVQLEPDVERTDRYGRTLAYVWRDAMLINWWLVRSGWARTLTVPPNVRYVDPLREAQRAARAEGRGLWDRGTFACSPGAQADRGC